VPTQLSHLDVLQADILDVPARRLFGDAKRVVLLWDAHGDELGRTQRGNNNAYCQDNEISWLEWEAIGDEGRALTAFVRKLTMLRHAFPILRRGRFLTADWNEELQVKEVTWINAAGTEMEEGQWADGNMRCFGMLLDGRARETGIKRPGSDATLLLCLNAHSDVVNFTLPPFADGTRWLCLIDTNDADRADLRYFKTAEEYAVTSHSVLLFAGLIAGEGARAVRRIALELSRGDALTT
jgi:glycogen operon protein